MVLIRGAKLGYLIEYLSDADGTYLDGSTALGAAYFGGSASRFLGLIGEYDRKKFMAAVNGHYQINGEGQFIDANYHSSGVKTDEDGGKKELDAATEIILAPPKSFSIGLHYAKGATAQKLKKIVEQAKREAMEFIEQQAMVRITENGVTRSEHVQGIAYTGFQHDTSRYGDMDMHDHVVVHRHALCRDGKLRTIDKASLIYIHYQADAVLKTSLTRQCAEQGIAVIATPEGPELASISKEMRDVFSRGTAALRERLAQEGIDLDKVSMTQKGRAMLDVRLAKIHLSPEHLAKHYDQKLKEAGIDLSEVLKGLKASRAYKIKPTMSAVKAFDLALQAVHERSDVIKTRYKLILDAARMSDYKIPAEELSKTIDHLIDLGEIVLRHAPQPGERARAASLTLTTRYAIEREAVAVRMFRAMRGQGAQVCSREAAAAAIEQVQQKILTAIRKSNPETGPVHLTQGQQDMVYSALGITTNDRFVVIEGDPGTGKTTGMEAVRIAATEAGWRVRGLAPSDNARDALTSSGIEAETVQLATRNPRYWDELDANTVLILDEAGMVDTKSYNHICAQCAKRGIRLVSVGDRKQIQSVEAGTPYADAADAADASGALVRLSEMTRGRTNDMRRLHDLSRDDPAAAIEMLVKGSSAGRMSFVSERQQRIDLVAQKLAAMSPQERITHPVIVDTNADRKEVNDAVRALIQQETAYSVESFEADQKGTRAELLVASSYELGKHLRIDQSANGLSRGTLWKIVGREGELVKIEDGNGIERSMSANLLGKQASIGSLERVNIGRGELIRIGAKWRKGDLLNKTDIRNGDRAIVREITSDGMAKIDLIDWSGNVKSQAEVDFSQPGIAIRSGYATTVHGVQGATIDRGTYLVSHTSRNSFMVATTRFRHEVEMVFDAANLGDLQHLVRKAQTPQFKERALGMSEAERQQLRAMAVNAAWPVQQVDQSAQSAAAKDRPMTLLPYSKQGKITVNDVAKFLRGIKDKYGHRDQQPIVITGSKAFLSVAQRAAQQQRLAASFTFRSHVAQPKEEQADRRVFLNGRGPVMASKM